MDVGPDDEAMARAREAFARGLAASCPALPPAIAAELAAEASPVLSAIFGALFGAATQNESERHEALALATLFGRRVATLGESPTTALACVDAIVAALPEPAHVPSETIPALRAAAMEGFAAAVDERARQEMIERAGQTLVPVIVSPRVVLLVIAGVDDAETIAQALARLGRTALDADAKACLVHASFAQEPQRDVVAEIAAFDNSATMIGARAIFCGTPVALHALSAHAPSLTYASTFEDALRRGLEAAEQEVRPASLLARSLKRLRGGPAGG